MSDHRFASARSTSSLWKWGVCGLLMLATMINYMDRLTLNQSAKRIMDELHFAEDGYGKVEGWFGLAFAVGALFWGWLVDRFNVRWAFAISVVLWSIAGAATGLARNFDELLWCRVALGFFEAANWPCAIRTTQRLLRAEERTMGNSILQSGAAVGAIITPMIVLVFIYWTSAWQPAFWFVGAIGLVWTVLWLIVVRSEDLAHEKHDTASEGSASSLWQALLDIWSDRRFWALAWLVVVINTTWHFFRAWLPLYLQTVLKVSEMQTMWFSSGYYFSAYLGSMSAGFATLFLIRRGGAVHSSRMRVFLAFALLALLSIPAAYLENTAIVLVLFLITGFAALGVFPNYYSFTQELSTRHQGKVTGMLGFSCWAAMFFLQVGVGRYVTASKAAEMPGLLASGLLEKTAAQIAARHAYTPVVAAAGVLPLLGFLAIALFWRERGQGVKQSTIESEEAHKMAGASRQPAAS